LNRQAALHAISSKSIDTLGGRPADMLVYWNDNGREDRPW
jgi:hypothetical protein